MKVNEAPERIWIDSPRDLPCGFIDKDSVEYIRADVFIDKAKKWFEEHFMNRLEWEIATYEFKDIQSLKENFKNAMNL